MNILPNLHEDRQEFLSVLSETAQRIGILETMVEKDYWVTWCLHYLFEYSPWKTHLGFKGGTCISKAYNLIERFSEDIDVLMDWTLLGFSAKEPMEPTTNNKKDKIKKEMNKRTVKYLKDHMLPVIQRDIKNMLGPEFNVYISDTDKMSIRFSYPKITTGDDYIVKDVVLEIGPMSQWSEMDYCSISSMMEQVFPSLELFPPLQVLCVSPERTFWDKISILQNHAHLRDKNINKNINKRNSRHYYDVYCLLKSDYKESCLSQSKLFFDTMEFSSRFYPVTSFDYKSVNFENIRLRVDKEIYKQLEEDYLEMKNMFFGEVPSFDIIYKTILDFEKELHKLGKAKSIPIDNMVYQAKEIYKKNKKNGKDKAQDKSEIYWSL